jgi:hypothetical protein
LRAISSAAGVERYDAAPGAAGIAMGGKVIFMLPCFILYG